MTKWDATIDEILRRYVGINESEDSTVRHRLIARAVELKTARDIEKRLTAQLNELHACRGYDDSEPTQAYHAALGNAHGALMGCVDDSLRALVNAEG